MRAAYLFHAVNLAVSMLMLPLLLAELSIGEYAIWLIFTAFGGATLQIQNAIQNVVVKDLARGFYGGSREIFDVVWWRTRRAYLFLALIVAGPVLVFGLFYLERLSVRTVTLSVELGWVIFVLSYALVYLFTPRNILLIGTDRVDVYNNINTLTRILYFIGIVIGLQFDLAILGICIGFAFSTMVGSVLAMFATRAPVQLREPVPGAGQPLPVESNVLNYALFSTASFGLYNGMLLVAASMFPEGLIASYGLALQIGTLLTALSIAPLQVWLGKLTTAVALGDRKHEGREVARTQLVTNLVFVPGFAGVVVLGSSLLRFIGSDLSLPPSQMLLLFGAAFLVELNIVTLVNYHMIRGDYGFVLPYVVFALVGVCLSVIAALLTHNIYAFIVLPLVIQGLIALPLLLKRTRAALGIGYGDFIRNMGAVFGSTFAAISRRFCSR